MEQYPHDIIVTMEGSMDRDEEGNFYIPAPPNMQAYKGRYEPKDGEGGFIRSEDSKFVSYNAIVYIKRPVNPIPVGSRVDVTRDGRPVASGTVSRFFESSYNAQIWL